MNKMNSHVDRVDVHAARAARIAAQQEATVTMIRVQVPVSESTAALRRRKTQEALIADAVNRAAPDGENNAEIIEAVVNLVKEKKWR